MRFSLIFPALLGMFFWVGCGGNNTPKKETDDTASTANATTAIELEGGEADLGKITVGDTLFHTFKFKNTGQSPLVLDGEPKVTCECTKVMAYPQNPVQPGAMDSVVMRYASKETQTGMQKKAIALKANTEPPVTKLKFRVEVNPKK